MKKLLLRLRLERSAKKARETTRKSVLDRTALPGKLADCSSKNPEECEIYIVEGDSAGDQRSKEEIENFKQYYRYQVKL